MTNLKKWIEECRREIDAIEPQWRTMGALNLLKALDIIERQQRELEKCNSVVLAKQKQCNHFKRQTTEARKLLEKAREALKECIDEIEYFHADMLTEEERAHPRGSGWARVYDKARAVLKEIDD